MTRLKVLVVDDSALMRKMIPHMLAADPGIEVVGTAMDGVFALKKIREMKPDVVTLDVDMPRMDGIETLHHIVADFRVPVIIVSSLARRDAELTLQALQLGAFDFVTKPQDAISVHINDIAAELVAKVRAAGGARPAHMKIITSRAASSLRKKRIGQLQSRMVLAIGTSTGGPNALSYILPQLPANFPAGIVIVQHMPAGFTEMFAARLNGVCALEVKEARDGDLVLPGRALIAPGNRHLRIKRMPLGTIAVLSDAAPVSGHRPSVDVLFRSVAAEYGHSATGLIMTGMGADGAEGLGEIKAAGGVTLAQDEASCVVFGMPKVAIDRGHVARVIALAEMGNVLTAQFMGQEVLHGSTQ
jgi:two-component system chemotaxis response regulator CheB